MARGRSGGGSVRTVDIGTSIERVRSARTLNTVQRDGWVGRIGQVGRVGQVGQVGRVGQLGPAGPDRFDRWVAGLEARHLADLRFSDVSGALRAVSSAYVERRGKLAQGAAPSGAGKRAAL